MFNFIKCLIKKVLDKQKLSKPIKEKNKIGSISSLSFVVNTDGTLDIICDWPNFSNSNDKEIANTAKFFALAINAINSGMLEKDIISTLKNYQKENHSDSLFVYNTLVELINIEKQQNLRSDANKPIIAPSEVFNVEE